MDFLLDTIIEMIFEVFLEGSIEATMSSKVPKFLRFILLSILIMIFSGLLYVAIAVAIEHKSLMAWICSALILVIGISAFRKKYREYLRKIETEQEETNA